jgi:hypothetical protein
MNCRLELKRIYIHPIKKKKRKKKKRKKEEEGNSTF